MSMDQRMPDELKKIRELLEPKTCSPTPPPPKGMWKEFMDFISKHKVMGLTVAHGEDEIRELGLGFPV